MAQQLETASIEATEDDATGERPSAEIPTSPASLWASEGKVLYSITHSPDDRESVWVESDSVVHTA